MKILIFDTETGGFNPLVNGITQVTAGAVTYSRDWSTYEVDEIFDCMVKPIPGLVYEQEALDIQHRTLEELETGLPIGKALQGVEQLAVRHFGKTKAATPYGINVKFDVDFVDANVKRYRLQMPFNFVYRDVCQWFRLLQDLGCHECYRANLDSMLTHYGIDVAPEDRHTAKGDVLATAEVIKRIHGDLLGARQAAA